MKESLITSIYYAPSAWSFHGALTLSFSPQLSVGHQGPSVSTAYIQPPRHVYSENASSRGIIGLITLVYLRFYPVLLDRMLCWLTRLADYGNLEKTKSANGSDAAARKRDNACNQGDSRGRCNGSSSCNTERRMRLGL